MDTRPEIVIVDSIGLGHCVDHDHFAVLTRRTGDEFCIVFQMKLYKDGRWETLPPSHVTRVPTEITERPCANQLEGCIDHLRSMFGVWPTAVDLNEAGTEVVVNYAINIRDNQYAVSEWSMITGV